MSQLSYDIAEFVVNNRDEIIHYLNEETDHLKYAERLFDSSPEIYDEMLANFRKSKLTHYLLNHFNENVESISAIVDDQFINKILYS